MSGAPACALPPHHGLEIPCDSHAGFRQAFAGARLLGCWPKDTQLSKPDHQLSADRVLHSNHRCIFELKYDVQNLLTDVQKMSISPEATVWRNWRGAYAGLAAIAQLQDRAQAVS